MKDALAMTVSLTPALSQREKVSKVSLRDFHVKIANKAEIEPLLRIIRRRM
jgi:hypothetical protein